MKEVKKIERSAIIVLTVPQLLEEWLTPVERFCECFKVPVGKKERKAASDDFFFSSMIKKNVCEGKIKKKRNWYGGEMKTTMLWTGRSKKFLLRKPVQPHEIYTDTSSIVYALKRELFSLNILIECVHMTQIRSVGWRCWFGETWNRDTHIYDNWWN